MLPLEMMGGKGLMMRWTPASLFLAMTALAPAAAQSPQPPAAAIGHARFAEFFKPLIGTWPVQILDRDANGKTEYATVQLREFRFTMGGAYVRERALVRDSKGLELESGIHLYGYDPASDRVLIHGFWGNSADRFILVPSTFVGEGRQAKLVGTMTVTHPDGRTVKSMSEMAWDGSDRFIWRTYSKRPDGSTYTDEQLTYVISPVEVVPAR